MHEENQTDVDAQRRLITAFGLALRAGSGKRGVRLIETHISWVLLAGRYAYKVKKAINLGFLDFSTLDRRREYCAEEIRLNRRLAPQIYLDVVTLGGSGAEPVMNALPAIEYAVRMRRFALSAQFDRLIERGKLLPAHIDSLAVKLAHFHGELPVAARDSPFGTAAVIYAAAQQNFEHLNSLLDGGREIERLADLQKNFEGEFAACRALFELRQAQGHVRECHGDLHLANIVLLDGQAVPFDGIEFNPALRWIDVMSEVAFTLMDLMHHRRADLAWRFLNAWLELSGDFSGIPLLRFYIAYRAMVRAKVSAILAAQSVNTRQAAAARRNSLAYLRLAEQCHAENRPALIITHGLPASGKSTFAQIALEQLQAIRLRSDVERKRMFGLVPQADSHASLGIDLYGADISARTYARLLELARELLQAGHAVIVDAAFLEQERRTSFQSLARELSVPFAIAAMHADEEILHERIVRRQREARDASEADIAVLKKLRAAYQPLTAEEESFTADFFNGKEGVAASAQGWDRLNHLLGSD